MDGDTQTFYGEISKREFTRKWTIYLSRAFSEVNKLYPRDAKQDWLIACMGKGDQKIKKKCGLTNKQTNRRSNAKSFVNGTNLMLYPASYLVSSGT